LGKINSSVADNLVFHAVGSVTDWLVFCSKQLGSIGTRHLPYENFLRKKKRARVKISNSRKRPGPAVLPVILDSNSDGCNGIFEQLTH
jgi:hypothetical protein